MTNGAEEGFNSPCKPNQKVEEENSKGHNATGNFPDIPFFTEEADIICDRLVNHLLIWFGLVVVA